MNICQLVWRNLLPNEQTGKWSFYDFLRDSRQMGLLFEHFVRNFYKCHRAETGFIVDRERIHWTWTSSDDLSRQLLPQMETDIRLRDGNRKILIECKFACITKTNQYEAYRLASSHLYQLNAYLTHLPLDPENNTCEAILLYPSDGIEYSLHYQSLQRQIEVRTLNLSQPWQGVHKNLLDLVREKVKGVSKNGTKIKVV